MVATQLILKLQTKFLTVKICPQVPDTKDIEEFGQMVMKGCDANGDGKINKRELTTVLLALAKHAFDEEQQRESNE